MKHLTIQEAYRERYPGEPIDAISPDVIEHPYHLELHGRVCYTSDGVEGDDSKITFAVIEVPQYVIPRDLLLHWTSVPAIGHDHVETFQLIGTDQYVNLHVDTQPIYHHEDGRSCISHLQLTLRHRNRFMPETLLQRLRKHGDFRIVDWDAVRNWKDYTRTQIDNPGFTPDPDNIALLHEQKQSNRVPESLVNDAASVPLLKVMKHYGIETYLEGNERKATCACPFCEDQEQGTIWIRNDINVYKCFGCGRAGNALTFVQTHGKLNFRDAVTLLLTEIESL